MHAFMWILLPITAALAFLLAGFVKGITGLGLPTVAIGLLSLVMAPAEAAALLVVPTLVTNLWQLAAGPSFAALSRRLSTMMLAICFGTWMGAGLLVGDTAGRATGALGAALVLYAIVGLAKLRFHISVGAERWLSPLVGAATGLVSAATGVFSIPAVPYLQALGLETEDLVQALGLSFTISTLALALDLARHGVLHISTASASALALMPALGGMLVGQRLRARIRPDVFRFYFFLALLVLGGDLALRAVY
jgi:uncharacterized membrane protein YfcA